MKAKTVRPLLIVLLFGFLSTSGWMIVQGGGDGSGGASRIIPTSRPLPTRTTAKVHALGPRSAPPPSSSPAGLHEQPSAPSMPNAVTRSAGPGASGAPYAPATLTASTDSPTGVPAHDAPGAVAFGTGDAFREPGEGFGEFGIPGTLPGGEDALSLGGGGRPGGASGSSGGSGGASGTGPGGLLNPPGATGGSSPGGSPVGMGGNPVPTVPEPPAAALFFAGMAALGWALRKPRRARN